MLLPGLMADVPAYTVKVHAKFPAAGACADGRQVQRGDRARASAARPSERQARTDQSESPDMTLPALASEPIENAEPSEPAEPIDRIDPAEPIDKMEPVEPMLRIDPLDPMLRIDPLPPRLVRMRTLSQQGTGPVTRSPDSPESADHGSAGRLWEPPRACRLDRLDRRTGGLRSISS